MLMRACQSAIACVLALCGLVSIAPAQEFIGPSGQPIYRAECKADPSDCLRSAGATCQGPYQVVDSESHAGGMLADILPGPVTWFSMLYQCGPSDGRMPTFQFRGPEYRPPSFASCSVFGQSVYCWGS